ncbi:MAG: hypothetical protein LBD23_18755, partial [Oscillospiraceae bacterium]|nr:hypothetical protein [Oscillospiraceae bacterium]
MPDNPSVPVYITEVKSVTSVRAGHGETVGTYKIQFSPEFAFSATGPYTGKFYVKLIPLTSSTQIGSTYEPQYIGNGATHEITATGLETGKRYKIVVSGSDDFAKSKNAIVTLREYAFPHMVFRNDNLTVKWQNNTKTHGMLSVSGDWDTAQPIPFGLAGFALPVTSEVYGEAHFKIKVAAAEESEGGTSLGPFSQEINAYFAVPKFTEAELSGGTLKITYDYSIAAHTVCLSLVRIGETPDTNALITTDSADKDIAALAATINDVLERHRRGLFEKSRAEAALKRAI